MLNQSKTRRRYRRHDAAVLAWIEFEGENAVRGMVSEDLSVEGAGFVAPRTLQPGSPVLVYLQLDPMIDAVECKGRTTWSRRMPDGTYRFGLRFLDLHCEERDRLAEFLRKPRRVHAHAAT